MRCRCRMALCLAMTSSAVDYSWWKTYSPGFLNGIYCLSLVRDVAPEELLRRLGAFPEPDLTGFGAFGRRWDDLPDERDDDVLNDYQLVGATTLTGADGAWTLLLEINGFLGIQAQFMEKVSSGTRAVSHFSSAKGMTQFHWYVDGDLRTFFEWPAEREGSSPDEIADVIARVGATGEPGLLTLEYFAMAEELSGVKITADLLDHAVYRTGIVPMTAEAKTRPWPPTDSD